MSSDFDEWFQKKLDQQKPKPTPEPEPVVDTTPVWNEFTEVLNRDVPKLRDIDGFIHPIFQKPDLAKGDNQPCSMSVTYNKPTSPMPHFAVLFFYHRNSKIECSSQRGRHIQTLEINGDNSTINFQGQWKTPEAAAGKFIIWVSEELIGGRDLR